VIDAMEGVQNLRKAIYEYRSRTFANPVGSKKYNNLMEVTLNYLYRYGEKSFLFGLAIIR
jgi:hypothetical protein